VISNCYNEGDISVSTPSGAPYNGCLVYVGGICGSAGGAISNCYNEGDVSASISSFDYYLSQVYVGGICGSAGGVISNCYNEGDVSASFPYSRHGPADGYVGGICGSAGGAISNCYNEGNISASISSFDYYLSQVYVGGICGSAGGVISNCYNEGDISASFPYSNDSPADGYVGGICGSAGGAISNCYNEGDISASFPDFFHGPADGYVGGICGSAGGAISNCYNEGNISANFSSVSNSWVYVGGVCGYMVDGVISSCYNVGDISATRFTPDHANSRSSYGYEGGICGYMVDGVISNCYNEGNISADFSDVPNSWVYVGGVCGCMGSGVISSCYNEGNISADFYDVPNSWVYVGGVCGCMESGVISSCYNVGDISDTRFVSNYSTDIQSPYGCVGGVCGYMESGVISSCYNVGDISATRFPRKYAINSRFSYGYEGGICGYMVDGVISSCYNVGDSTFSAPDSADYIYGCAGGICGYSENTVAVIQACAVFSETLNGLSSSYTVGYGGNKTSNIAVIPNTFSGTRDATQILFDEAQKQSTYEEIGWNFTSVWEMVPDYLYPQLQGLPVAGPDLENVPIGILASDPSKSYFYVIDAYSVANVDSLPDAVVTIGIQTTTTDKRGLASFDWQLLDQSAPLKVEKSGYLRYVWPYTGGYGADFRMIALRSDRGIPDIVWTRLTKPAEQNGKAVDVSISSVNIMGSQDIFNLEVFADYTKGELAKCELMQGDKLIKTSTTHNDGIFTFSDLSGERDGFVPNKDIYVQITAVDGTVSEVIRLNIFLIPDALVTDNFSIDVDAGPKINIDADVPLIKGFDFTLDLNKIKADVTFDGEKVMIALGVKLFERDLSANQDAQAKKNNGLFNNFKDEVMEALKGKSALDQLLKDSKYPQSFLNDVKFNVYVTGYLEGKWWGDNQYLTGALLIKVEVAATKEFQYFVYYVPLVVGVDLSASAELKFSGITYNLSERKFDQLGFDMAMTIVLPSIEARGGLGVAYVASAGVYGTGALTLNQHITSPSYGQLSFDYSFGFYTKLLFFTIHLPIYGDDVLIARWGTNPKDSQAVLMQYLESSADDFELSTRVHSSPWYGEVPHQKTLQENVYVETAPLISEVAGRRVMVFLMDDPNRGDMDRTKLMYSLYDETLDTWSTPLPVMVDDKGTADFFPSLHSDGNNLYVTWHKSKNTFEELAALDPFTALDAMFAASEIAVAKFNVATGTFTDVTYITDNDFMDTVPSIAVYGDEVFAVWVSNIENDWFGTSENNLNNIMYSALQNGVWSEPKVLVSGLGAVIQLDAGYLDGEPCVAYITDTDNDFSTLNDRNLLLSYLSGNTVVLTDDVFVSNPDFTCINGVDVISWYSDGNIFYMSSDGCYDSLFDESAAGLLDVYKIITDGEGKTAVVYAAKDSDGVGYIYGHMYDTVSGRWSPRFKVAETGDEWFARYIDGLIDGDDIYLAFTNTKTELTETSVTEESNLCVLKIEPHADIKLDAVFYKNGDVHQGTVLPMTLLVENTGNLAMSGIDVKANGVAIDRIVIDEGLLPGESIWLDDVMLNIPQDMSANTAFIISVEPLFLTDVNPYDNFKTIVLGFADIALELETYRVGDTVKVVANVVNFGDYDVSNVVLSACLDGSSDNAFRVEYGDLVVGQKKLTVIDIDPRDYDLNEEGFGILQFMVSCEQEEASLSNNADFIVLRTYEAPPSVFTPVEPAPFYTVAFDSTGGSEIVSQRVMEGSKVLLPIEPTKVGHTFAGWYIGEVAFDFDAVIMNDVTLVAKWNVISVVINEITIDTLPTKKVYSQDEILDLSGLVVMATYSDGRTMDVTDSVSVSPAQNTVLTDAGTRVITLTYVEGEITKNAIFTVKVNQQSYTVCYNIDGVMTGASAEFVGDTVIIMSDVPKKIGYTFAGWLYNGVMYSDGDTFKMPNNDVVLVAQWDAANVEYVVHYYLAGSTDMLFASKTGSGIMDTSVSESALSIVGYSVDAASKSLTLAALDNEIVFYYTAESVSYDVHYYLAGTTISVADSKLAKAGVMGVSVSESALPIAGYFVDAASKSLTLAALDNEIVFYYSPLSGIEYVVHYYLQGTTTSLATTKTGSGVMGISVSEDAVTVSGYTAVTPTAVITTLNATNNEIVFYYVANTNIQYTVYYYLQGTTNSVALAKTVSGQTMNDTITERAVTITGYTAVNPITATAILNATGNVFTFYYAANTSPGESTSKPTTSTPSAKTIRPTETLSPPTTTAAPSMTPTIIPSDDNDKKHSTYWTFNNIALTAIVAVTVLAILWLAYRYYSKRK